MRFCFFVILLFSLSAQASYDTMLVGVKVKSVRVYSGSLVLITLENSNSSSKCSRKDYYELHNPDSESGKRLYSAILIAYTSGNKVNLALKGCNASNGWPLFTEAWLN